MCKQVCLEKAALLRIMLHRPWMSPSFSPSDSIQQCLELPCLYSVILRGILLRGMLHFISAFCDFPCGWWCHLQPGRILTALSDLDVLSLHASCPGWSHQSDINRSGSWYFAFLLSEGSLLSISMMLWVVTGDPSRVESGWVWLIKYIMCN